MRNIFKQCMVLMLLASGLAHAIPCPSVQEFTTHLVTSPYAYYPKINQTEFMSLSLSADLVNQDKGFVLVFKSLRANPESDHKALVAEQVAQLRNVNADSLQESDADFDFNLPYCLYTNPKNPNISAIAYYLDMNTDLDMDVNQGENAPIHLLQKKLGLNLIKG